MSTQEMSLLYNKKKKRWEILEFSHHPCYNDSMSNPGTNSPETPFFSLMFTFPIHLLPSLIPPPSSQGLQGVHESSVELTKNTDSGDLPPPRDSVGPEELQDLRL